MDEDEDDGNDLQVDIDVLEGHQQYMNNMKEAHQ